MDLGGRHLAPAQWVELSEGFFSHLLHIRLCPWIHPHWSFSEVPDGPRDTDGVRRDRERPPVATAGTSLREAVQRRPMLPDLHGQHSLFVSLTLDVLWPARCSPPESPSCGRGSYPVTASQRSLLLAAPCSLSLQHRLLSSPAFLPSHFLPR